MYRADRIVMPDAGHAVDHDRAGIGRAIERFDRLHDRRLRQFAGKDRADEINFLNFS